jgi:hypothetical protein
MNAFIKTAISKIPLINTLISERDSLRHELTSLKKGIVSDQIKLQNEVNWLRNTLVFERNRLKQEVKKLKNNHRFVLPGHFYSPIPCLDEIRENESRIFENFSANINGIDLRETAQLNLLSKFIRYYNEMPFEAEKRDGLRYYFENPAYSYSDAIPLHCIIRLLKPKRIIEIGSGFSSCMILDTNEIYFGDSIDITLIEPYPQLLLSLIKNEDKQKIRIIPSRLQDMDLEEFEVLESDDILFIDSTHVSKIYSDVNRIFFDILPRLSSGVYIHFHDIFFPFEYPMDWIYEGRAWNEAYLLRAFLQFNSAFRVVLMNTFMQRYHESFYQQQMSLCLRNNGGSLWICKE